MAGPLHTLPSALLVLVAAASGPAARPAPAQCATAFGDLAPGRTEARPGRLPVWRRSGNGTLDVGDVVVLLRAAVGLVELGTPLPSEGPCALAAGDLAPGVLDESTTPATWHPVGNGHLDVGDVVAALRGTVDLQVMAPPERHPRLADMSSCAELESWIHQVALQSLEQYGTWSTGWWWRSSPFDDSDDAAAGPLPARSGGASDWSDTNVQVEGIDEADIIETDGELIYFLDGSRLRILDAWPAEDLHLVSTTSVEGIATGMYLDGNRLAVLSDIWGSVEPQGDPSPLEGDSATGLDAPFGETWGLSKISVFDSADPAAPQLVRELYVEGTLQASRRTDHRLHLVTYHALRGPEVPPWVDDHDAWLEKARTAVESSRLEDWLPRLTDLVRTEDGWTRSVRAVVDCDRVHRPDLPEGIGLAAVITLDLDDPGVVDRTGIFSSVGVVHATADRLDLTTSSCATGAWWRSDPSQALTRIHSFALGPNAMTRYLGSGEVPGTVDGSFALGRKGEELRVVTVQAGWGSGRSTSIHVLRPALEAGDLGVVGALEGLAPGEQLRAVRWVGDIGWVVTFVQVDPLFAIDVSDPTQPTVLGELHVTGFSNYLHPLRDTHLVGIGWEIDPVTLRTLGMSLSMFDVTKPSAPSLADRVLIATGWAESEAQWDHHAFNWFPQREVLAVPVVAWTRLDSDGSVDTSFSGLHVYRMTPETGIELLGVVDMQSLARPGQTSPWENPWCRQARRSVFQDDRVVALSPAGAVVADLDDLGHEIASAAFEDRPEYCR